MTITPVAFSPSETPVGRFPFRRTSLGVASARPAYNPPVVTASDAAPHPWRRVVLSHLEHTPDRLHLGPYAPPGDECAGECGVHEIDRDRVIEDAAHPEGVIAQPSDPQFSSSQAVISEPSNAVGKDFLPGGALIAAAPSGTGFQVSLYGLVGVLLAVDEGLELNVLGLNIGVDAAAPALKLPAIGRLGLDR
jgi:hypothetical protein